MAFDKVIALLILARYAAYGAGDVDVTAFAELALSSSNMKLLRSENSEFYIGSLNTTIQDGKVLDGISLELMTVRNYGPAKHSMDGHTANFTAVLTFDNCTFHFSKGDPKQDKQTSQHNVLRFFSSAYVQGDTCLRFKTPQGAVWLELGSKENTLPQDIISVVNNRPEMHLLAELLNDNFKICGKRFFPGEVHVDVIY